MPDNLFFYVFTGQDRYTMRHSNLLQPDLSRVKLLHFPIFDGDLPWLSHILPQGFKDFSLTFPTS